MTTPQSVLDRFRDAETPLRALSAYIEGQLQGWATSKGYLFSGRPKDPQSLSEKLESGRYAKWSDIDDMYATTIVLPTASHEEQAITYLTSTFEQVEIRRRNSTQKPADVFRFDSTRFIGRVRPEVASTLTPGVESIRFEVQLPTVFEYAWGVATHDLVYKGEEIDWAKMRLAAQLKSAVEQIDMIIAGFEGTASFIARSPHDETDAKSYLVGELKKLVAEGVIQQEIVPRSWSRLADNVVSLVKSYTTNKYKAHSGVRELVDALSASLRASPSTLRSGSLFQLIVAFVNSDDMQDAHLTNFVVVESQELRDFYGVTAVPKAFDLAN